MMDFRWDKGVKEHLREQARARGYNLPKLMYEPTIRIQAYGNEAAFGEYNKETGELKILDWSMVGDTNLLSLKQELKEKNDKGELHGSYMMIGIPKDIYQLRERFKGDKDIGY